LDVPTVFFLPSDCREKKKFKFKKIVRKVMLFLVKFSLRMGSFLRVPLLRAAEVQNKN